MKKLGNAATPVAGQCRRPPVRVTLLRADGYAEQTAPPDGESKDWWSRLNKALGTVSTDFVRASLLQLQGAARSPYGTISEMAINAALAMIEAAAPRDELEGALAVQMACTHTAAMSVTSVSDDVGVGWISVSSSLLEGYRSSSRQFCLTSAEAGHAIGLHRHAGGCYLVAIRRWSAPCQRRHSQCLRDYWSLVARPKRHEGASKKGPSNLNKCSHPTEPLLHRFTPPATSKSRRQRFANATAETTLGERSLRLRTAYTRIIEAHRSTDRHG